MRIHLHDIFYVSQKTTLPNHLVMEIQDPSLPSSVLNHMILEYIKEKTGYVAHSYSISLQMIRANHPDLKGSFTCLGNWYNLFNKESMDKLNNNLKTVTPTDLKTAKDEIKTAKAMAEKWTRNTACENAGLYEFANAQGDWSVKF